MIDLKERPIIQFGFITIMNKILKRFIKIQKNLRKRIVLSKNIDRVKTVLGVDVSYKGDFQYTVVVEYDVLEGKVKDVAVKKEKVVFPYIPTFLSFREGPYAVKTIKKHFDLKEIDVVLVDGQGIAHPRELGLATYIGILIEKPTIGVAKSHLFGKFVEPEEKKGSFTYIFNKNRKIGVVLRTRDKVKPLFVSPGNMIDIEKSKDIVLSLCVKYRIPEPIRIADKISKRVKEELWERNLV